MTIERFDRERDLAGVLDLVGRSLARGDSGAIVLVWGSTANPEAEAHYLSAGMRRGRVLRDYRLALA